MAIENSFVFGGVSTTTYNVLVEGSGDYSGAKRVVEMISIPGRNGELALDKGHFENEPVEYEVLIQGATQATFEQAVSAFKNAIMSKTGYQRLTDTYHSGEYRMAVYVGGFDEEPTFHGKGASFKLEFSCKPQRWLTSGETAVSVASGGTVTNPTLFEASPLLEVEGHGNVQIGDNNIFLSNLPLGNITVLPNESEQKVFPQSTNMITVSGQYSTEQFNQGDTLTLASTSIRLVDYAGSGNKWSSYSVASNSFFNASVAGVGTPTVTVTLTPKNNITHAAGTALSETTKTATLTNRTVTYSGGSATFFDVTVSFLYGVTVNGTEETLTEKCYTNNTFSSTGVVTLFRGIMRGYSTVPVLGNPTYIDCELGDAYKIEDGKIIGANSRIDLGSDVPKLAPGATTVTFDNTVTDLKIHPRWWKV